MGNAATLSESDSVWSRLILDAMKRDCFHNADDDKKLAKAIEDALLEIQLLDELETPLKSLSLQERSETATATTSRYVKNDIPGLSNLD